MPLHIAVLIFFHFFLKLPVIFLLLHQNLDKKSHSKTKNILYENILLALFLTLTFVHQVFLQIITYNTYFAWKFVRKYFKLLFPLKPPYSTHDGSGGKVE